MDWIIQSNIFKIQSFIIYLYFLKRIFRIKLFVFFLASSNEKLGPMMNFSSDSKSFRIFGEANIIRYFNRLINSVSDDSAAAGVEQTDSFIINEWIDKCSNDLRLSSSSSSNNTNSSNKYLHELNKYFGTPKATKFLASEKQYTIADLCTWSVLKQQLASVGLEVAAAKLVNVIEWLKRIENVEPLVPVLNLLWIAKEIK